MNDIIEHYGKVVVALAGVLAAVLLTVAVLRRDGCGAAGGNPDGDRYPAPDGIRS